MQIKVITVSDNERKSKPEDESALRFGELFTDHMFLMSWNDKEGWQDAQIKKFEPLQLSPAAIVLHYANEIFEGLKAYKTPENHIILFRPRKNFERLNNSAERMVLPQVDIDFVLKALKKLILIEKDWVPSSPGTSLYIRPTMIGVDPFIGVRPPSQVLFFIILSPVGPYFPDGFKPVNILVETKYVRAVGEGGTGDAKCGGNYAGSLKASTLAKKKGYAQVLWLDSKKKYVEEVGTMNMVFVFEDEVVTAPLDGSILPGITRDSILTICRDWGYNVSERKLTITEVVKGIKNGTLIEAFGCGTAAIITPTGSLNYKNNDYVINNGEIGGLTQKLYDYLTGIQYGLIPDEYEWTERVI
ncbi:MAG: branched-chain amino acid aminotransferase [Candidatus Lokiarchaeota archaeon]|nr:branched-chain amino acid aminotransferase [Candidatus Lokiarchaeota archaeon]